MDKTEWKASLVFFVKCLISIVLYPFWAIWAAVGRTDYTHYVWWIEKLRPLMPNDQKETMTSDKLLKAIGS